MWKHETKGLGLCYRISSQEIGKTGSKSALNKNLGARSVTRTRDLQMSQEINDASYKSPYESGAPTD